MKKIFVFLILILSIIACCPSCVMENKPSADVEQQLKTELAMKEANRQVGMPAIHNFQEKKMLKWIYELCDQEKMICHAYLFNELKGEVGQYLGTCIGYGIPYSTQFSNPEKPYDRWVSNGHGRYAGELPQPEPNGLFKPEGLSATWLIMVDPNTKKPRPIYVEPTIIVSPFKLH
jgi:hypothetical protein